MLFGHDSIKSPFIGDWPKAFRSLTSFGTNLSQAFKPTAINISWLICAGGEYPYQ
jgi:hypothetical protein